MLIDDEELRDIVDRAPNVIEVCNEHGGLLPGSFPEPRPSHWS